MNRSVTFTLTEEEALNALKSHYQRKSVTPKTLRKMFYIWTLCLVLVIAVVIAIDGMDWTQHWGRSVFKTALVYLGIIAALLAFNVYILVPRGIRRLLKNDRQIGLSQTLYWDDRALAIRSSYIRGTYPFRLFYNWRDYPTALALYLNDDKFNIVPKSALSDEQLKDLREILAREIVPPQKGNKKGIAKS